MPLHELERLAAVNRFLKLEISKEKEIQEIVELAAKICGTTTALVTLIDDETLYIKFKVGTDRQTASRQESFCSHVIEQDNVMMVPDAMLDERFINNPNVVAEHGVRFYAGSPLTTQDGYNLGSLCVVDQAPKKLSSTQQQMLQILSRQVIHLLEFDTSLQILKEQFITAKSAEIKLRSFFESSSSCHLLIGKDMDVLAFNKALADFVAKNYGVAIATGMKVADYIHPSYAAEFTRNYAMALAGTPVQLERKIQYQEEFIWWHFTYDPARNPDGEIIGVSYNATNITQRVEQEQRVIAQNESLKRIAWTQSHELRRPVASIMGIMNIFKADDYTVSREDLLMMEKAVNELDEKIRKIVDDTD